MKIIAGDAARAAANIPFMKGNDFVAAEYNGIKLLRSVQILVLFT